MSIGKRFWFCNCHPDESMRKAERGLTNTVIAGPRSAALETFASSSDAATDEAGRDMPPPIAR